MHILLVNNTAIPALKYGGTERVIWWLGKYLVRAGHRVTYLVKAGSSCPFADVLPYSPTIPLERQIPAGIDITHVHFPLRTPLATPHIVTVHGCGRKDEKFIPNTVFVSANHARDHGAECFVHNGLDIEDYEGIPLDGERKHLLFLARTVRKEKNLRGAMELARATGQRLAIVGGWGFSLHPRFRYYGMIGGTKKNRLLAASKALLFPILWSEPFGLAVIEALYAGCPVFGSPYGALPEIVTPATGVLSTQKSDLIDAIGRIEEFSHIRCRERVLEQFTAPKMTEKYLAYYRQVLDGQPLHTGEVGTADFVHGRKFIFE